MSLSKKNSTLLTSLQTKKYRTVHQLFIAEGSKVVKEFLNSHFELYQLFCVVDDNFNVNEKTILISENELSKISNLKSPNNVVAVFKIPQQKQIENNGLIVVLDEINDPGNLGTIIRLCDWFGVHQLVCSLTTVDCYNSKVVQASMGSLTRVNINYTNLETFLKENNLPKYIAAMNGSNVYGVSLPQNAILILGNEANGISKEVEKSSTKSVTIPRFGNIQQTESLNVATAAAILLNEFRRGN